MVSPVPQLHVNNMLSLIHSFYKIIEQKASEQISFLTNPLSSGTGYDHKLASGKGGFRPNMHVETELVRRTKNAGLSHYIKPIDFDAQQQEYSDALAKSEHLMTKDKEVNFSLRRLVQAGFTVYKLLSSHLSNKLSPIAIEEAASLLNFNASSGYPLYKKKGTVVNELIRQAKTIPFEVWRRWPTSRSFRRQLQVDTENTLKSKIRVIYPYPGIITLLENRFVQPIINYFVANDTPYVTGKTGQYVSEHIQSAGRKYPHSFSADIEAFDQNMPNCITFISFAVLRCFFKLDKNDALLFEQIASYYTSANLVSRVGTQESEFVVKTSGIPSGTGWTNLMGTISHLIILAYYDSKWFDKHSTLVCSDDNLTFTRHAMDATTLQMAYSRWGLTVSVAKTQFFQGISKVHFLGFDWIYGKRIINPHLAINQMIYHTDFIKDLSFYDRIIGRAASILLNGQNGASYFDKIFPDIHELVEDDRHFYFLPNYPLPTTPNIISSKRSRRMIESLDYHKKYGWLIR